jgi:hypothetical protein
VRVAIAVGVHALDVDDRAARRFAVDGVARATCPLEAGQRLDPVALDGRRGGRALVARGLGVVVAAAPGQDEECREGA